MGKFHSEGTTHIIETKIRISDNPYFIRPRTSRFREGKRKAVLFSIQTGTIKQNVVFRKCCAKNKRNAIFSVIKEIIK